MTTSLPKHVAIIMDGNGRWAKKRFLPRVIGHQAGVKCLKAIVRDLAEKGVEALTLYAFSTENWKRSKDEVGFLMNLIIKTLKKELKELHQKEVCFRTIGDLSGLPEAVQAILKAAELLMKDNKGIKLNVALNYGGRAEIVRATQEIGKAILAGEFNPLDLTEEKFSQYLYTKGLPDLDLMIRTSGECRISNFLIWQAAYTEIYFTDTLFPDFDLKELQKALEWYQTRERRYGKTSEQLKEKKHEQASHAH